MARVTEQPGWVLHARPYRETSALLEVLTRDHGRVGLVARGSRGPKSRWKGILQPFRPLLIGWSQRGELGTLTAAEQIAAPPPLNGEALYCGLYINELLMRLMQRSDPHPAVFDAYRQALAGLASETETQPLLRVFERDLVAEIGFALRLDRDGHGASIDATAHYRWLPEQGFVVVSDAGERQAVSGRALLALECGEFSEPDLPELRRLMRSVLRYHLGDKPLVTPSLFY